MTAPVVALVLGAAAATGAYALIDDGGGSAQAAKVIVVETPAPGSADIAGKSESATAAAITQSSGVDLRGSKASASGSDSAAADSARTDPHGTAVSLRNP
jgi:hypothetical protein